MLLHHFTGQDPADALIGTELETHWPISYYWTAKRQGGADPAEFSAARLDRLKRKNGWVAEATFRAELLKEYVFEAVRVESYPQLPSRTRCMFLFDREIDPAAYAARLVRDPARLSLLEIEVLPGSRVHRGRLSALDCNAWAIPEIERQAQIYWCGVNAPDSDSEVLLEGRFVVRGILGRAGSWITL